jgi:hypothetical protein
VVGAAFAALGGVLAWRGHSRSALVCGSIGAVLILLGATFPDTLRPVYRLWMGMAVAMSKVTTPVIMGVVYFGVMTPIGLVRRLAGGNPLKHRTGDAGLWIVRDDRARSPKDLERQF